MCGRFKSIVNFILHFICGFLVSQAYYVCLIKAISIPFNLKVTIYFCLSIVLGVGNAVSIQVRCITCLSFLMYCGKPGRGVLKAVLLTYVVKGPITNMGLNAKEIVRVFGCSSELSYNISTEKYFRLYDPIRTTIRSLQSELYQIKATLRYFGNVISLLEREIEEVNDFQPFEDDNDYIYQIYDLFNSTPDFALYNIHTRPKQQVDNYSTYIKTYINKLNQRCMNQIHRSQIICKAAFSSSYINCYKSMPNSAAWTICWPVKLPQVCASIDSRDNSNMCTYEKQIDPGLAEGYAALKWIKMKFADKTDLINLRRCMNYDNALYDIQDAEETSSRITHEFEEKSTVMRSAITIMDVCIAMLFFRIVHASIVYHDMYLTSIDYDNIYITSYFKRLDCRRKRKNQVTLLPLKKMEGSKYVDVHSLAYTTERSKLFTQILKVMLEMITATTFVMLDRLFYEALDVVRLYAEVDMKEGLHGMDIEIEGVGVLASILRKLVHNLNNQRSVHSTYSNELCIPRPRLMPYIYFIKIYGGYLWISLLLYISPYTIRLRRLVCSYFYSRREKQRVLHLYNDILKRRMKLQKTLRRGAAEKVLSPRCFDPDVSSQRKLMLNCWDANLHPIDRVSVTLSTGLSSYQLFASASFGTNLQHIKAAYKKAVQAVRTHYLYGENILTLRMKFPQLLGWLKVFPTARMSCLICGETEPRKGKLLNDMWHFCTTPKCPFVFCGECWNEIGRRCLACDPSLADLTDIDSLSDDI